MPPELIALLDSPAAQPLVQELLVAIGTAFSQTASVRDPLPDTAPDSPEQGLAILAGIDHLRAILSHLDASWQVTTDQRMRAADAARDVRAADQGRAAAHEIALARRISPASSAFSLASSHRLVTQMPHLRAALAAARITERQVGIITSSLSTADPATISQVDTDLALDPARLDGLGNRRLRDLVHERVHRAHPAGSRERAERAARGRHVTCTPQADGMARITATLRGLDAAAVMTALRARAQADKAAGDKTAAGCLEADHLVRSVLAPSSSRPAGEDDASPSSDATDPVAPTVRIELGIVLTDRALFDQHDDGESAQMDGYGTIPAHVVRDTLAGHPPGQILDSRTTPLAETSTARDCGGRGRGNSHRRGSSADDPPETAFHDPPVEAFFRRLYTQPRTGELIAMGSISRRFPVAMARFFRWRDLTCRMPWCNAAIRQYDHIMPWAAGGATSIGNGQALCTRCNLIKEHGNWSVTASQDEDTGATSVDWTSPHGGCGTSSTPRTGPSDADAA